MELLTNSYDYNLPKELIAKYPANPKDSSKLLVYNRKEDKIYHQTFRDILDFIPKNTSIICNDTKVIKARIFGNKESGGKIELLLNKPISEKTYNVFIRGKVKVGTKLSFEKDLICEILELIEDGSRVVKFIKDNKELEFSELIDILEKIGNIPLPPYLNREADKNDDSLYQTVFAKKSGSVAAPTASLHFTDKLFNQLKENFKTSFVTLNVGAGTFKPVDAKNILEHKIHSEYYQIQKNTLDILNSNDKLLTIGTTSTRVVEYYQRTKKENGNCNLFLHPQNKPLRVNYLLTNFHLPKSTLIMLVASFIGLEKSLEIYNIAIENRYRFYSYGDAMLII